MLLSEKNIGEAAAKSAVNEKTLQRWLLNAESFKAEYVAARQAAFQAGIHRVQALTARAVDTRRRRCGVTATCTAPPRVGQDHQDEQQPPRGGRYSSLASKVVCRA